MAQPVIDKQMNEVDAQLQRDSLEKQQIGSRIQRRTETRKNALSATSDSSSNIHYHNSSLAALSSSSEAAAAVANSPLYERLVTEEVHRIMEHQRQQIADLQALQNDLETRLENETRRRLGLEATLEAREREWDRQVQLLEQDREHWRGEVHTVEAKNDRLHKEVVRLEQQIQRMVQRKVSCVFPFLCLILDVSRCARH